MSPVVVLVQRRNLKALSDQRAARWGNTIDGLRKKKEQKRAERLRKEEVHMPLSLSSLGALSERPMGFSVRVVPVCVASCTDASRATRSRDGAGA